MGISTASGAKFYIGPVTPVSAIDFTTDESALVDFEALTGWLEVKEIEDFGQHGDESNEVTFAALGDRRVRKLKGSRNAGTMAIVAGRDPLDAGQNAMIAAEKTDYEYAFKVVYADAQDETYTDSVEYFIGLVMSRPTNVGTVDNVIRRNFNVAINSDIIEVVSEEAGS